MAKINVTNITRDRFIAGDRFSVIRRRETINGFGESEKGHVVFDGVVGSVQPTGNNSLLREEAFQASAKTIKVITRFRLYSAQRDEAGFNYQPDLIYWGSNYYLVRILNDFTAFGAGFVEAECLSHQFDDLALGNGRPGALVFTDPGNSSLVGATCF